MVLQFYELKVSSQRKINKNKKLFSVEKYTLSVVKCTLYVYCLLCSVHCTWFRRSLWIVYIHSMCMQCNLYNFTSNKFTGIHIKRCTLYILLTVHWKIRETVYTSIKLKHKTNHCGLWTFVCIIIFILRI